MIKNKRLKDRWVAALRSGKYKQTKQVLHNKDTGGFCCLGVLREISPTVRKLRTYEGSCEVTQAPAFLSAAANTYVFGERWMSDGSPHDLAEMNDSGKTFKTIANYIEKNL